jgi:ATP synthase protein I
MSEKGEDHQWAERRASLDEKLGAHRARREVETRAQAQRGGGMRGMAEGLKIASEFISGIAVGALLGYGIDYFAGTGPFGLIIFLLLGFAAGVLNVVRSQSGQRGPHRADKVENEGDSSP